MRFKSENEIDFLSAQLFNVPFKLADKQDIKKMTDTFDELFNGSDGDEDDNKEKGSEEGFKPLPNDTIEVDQTSKVHKCEEGMTEIFGWMICKHCGNNMRQIK